MNLLPPPDDPYFGVLEVPNSTTTHRLTPGYAIVPDLGFTDPSKSSLAPTGRKRITAAAKSLHTSSSGGAELTSRQEAAINKHIQELDKDDGRDVKIEVPKGGGSGSGSGSGSRQQGKKTTTNVARILKSEKGFAHHLADEEAWRAQQQQHQHQSSSSGANQGHGQGKTTAGSSTPATTTKGHKPSLSKQLSTQAIASPSTTTPRQQKQQSEENLDSIEADPLLRTYAPSAPSAELMNALVSAAPLSYNQVRAAPSKNPTRRMYCAVCGYWGRVRCVKCGARVCGMGCKREHDAECGMMYA